MRSILLTISNTDWDYLIHKLIITNSEKQQQQQHKSFIIDHGYIKIHSSGITTTHFIVEQFRRKTFAARIEILWHNYNNKTECTKTYIVHKLCLPLLFKI